MSRPGWSGLLIALTIGFLAGAITVGIVVRQTTPVAPGAAAPSESSGRGAAGYAQSGNKPPVTAPAAPREDSGSSSAGAFGGGAPNAPIKDGARLSPPVAHIGMEPVADLRSRHLEVPVRGVSRDALHDSFKDVRGLSHHDAIDILAPRNTPVIAVEDGSIAKLFESKAGGTTIYQFDPANLYSYYYAHLERYANGLAEGARVRRGDVLGYVGTSGNAPKETPHLHFAIAKLDDDKKWWKGAAIDPYEVLK